MAEIYLYSQYESIDEDMIDSFSEESDHSNISNKIYNIRDEDNDDQNDDRNNHNDQENDQNDQKDDQNDNRYND